MSDKQSIIIGYYRKGESQRQISRKIGLSRPTVRKYIEEYEKEKEGGGEKREGEAILKSGIMEAPSYDSSTRKKRKMTEEIEDRIRKYMEENKEKKQSGRHKQMMKKIDIWEALQEGEYEISYGSVCNYVRNAEGKVESYIRQQQQPGEECEFDWGEVVLKIGGKKKKYQLAVFTLSWSNYRYGILFERQNMQSFQQSHVLFFEHIEGVMKRMVYDNMRVAVRRFVGRTEREATEGLISMSLYYQFEYRFCNIGKGNEKGHVERSVEYVRRKAFCREECFEDLKLANEHLAQTLKQLNTKPQVQKGESAIEQQEQAKPYMGLCPVVAMECAEWQSLRVDTYATICLNTNHYSVPEELQGKIVEVKVYAERLEVYYEKQPKCSHQRRYGSFEWSLNLEHYLKTLSRKPGALRNSQALAQAPELVKNIYERYFREQPRGFIELLQYQRNKEVSWQQIQHIIGQLLSKGCKEITLDKIKISLENAPVVEPVKADGQIEQMAKQQLSELADLFNYA